MSACDLAPGNAGQRGFERPQEIETNLGAKAFFGHGICGHRARMAQLFNRSNAKRRQNLLRFGAEALQSGNRSVGSHAVVQKKEAGLSPRSSIFMPVFPELFRVYLQKQGSVALQYLPLLRTCLHKRGLARLLLAVHKRPCCNSRIHRNNKLVASRQRACHRHW